MKNKRRYLKICHIQHHGVMCKNLKVMIVIIIIVIVIVIVIVTYGVIILKTS